MQNSLKEWLKVQNSKANFDIALRKLLSYACSSWLCRFGVIETPKIALAKFVAANNSECNIAEWLEFPIKYVDEIALFCENSKDKPLPAGVLQTVPSILDLRNIKCPINAAKSRLVMECLPENSSIDIYLDDGLPIENVPEALVADGHSILKRQKKGKFWVLTVVKRNLIV